jgi:hypothetical protein
MAVCRRFVAATRIVALGQLPGVNVYSLKIDVGPEDGPGRSLLLADCVDFADMASHLADFDLVIAADTLVAYSASALELPLWVLRKAQPDWRWSGGDANLWYHQARLFWQSQPGIWAGVLTEARYALATAAG